MKVQPHIRFAWLCFRKKLYSVHHVISYYKAVYEKAVHCHIDNNSNNINIMAPRKKPPTKKNKNVVDNAPLAAVVVVMMRCRIWLLLLLKQKRLWLLLLRQWQQQWNQQQQQQQQQQQLPLRILPFLLLVRSLERSLWWQSMYQRLLHKLLLQQKPLQVTSSPVQKTVVQRS